MVGVLDPYQTMPAKIMATGSGTEVGKARISDDGSSSDAYTGMKRSEKHGCYFDVVGRG